MGNSSNFQVILLVVFGFLAVIAVLMFAGVIPGASGLLSEKKGEEVVMWGPYRSDVINSYFENLNSANETVFQIKYEAQEPETYLDTLIEAFARGRGPDLFFVDQNMLNRLAGKLSEIPYANYPERDFINTYIDGAAVFQADSGLKALPLLADPLVMYYNRTLYSSAGIVTPPGKWDQFVATLKPLNEIDERGNFKRTGAPLGEFRNVKNAKYILSTLILQAGNPITAQTADGPRFALNNNYGFTPAPADSALSFYVQFSNPSLSTYSWNRSMVNDQDFFAAEKSAVYFGFGSELAELQGKNPHLNLDITLIPQKDLARRFVYGNFLGVSLAGNSKRKPVAYQAALALSSARNLENLAFILKLSPARRDLLSSPADDPFRQAINESVVFARSFIDPHPAKTQTIMTEMLEKVQTGQITVSQAVNEANGKINRLFNSN